MAIRRIRTHVPGGSTTIVSGGGGQGLAISTGTDTQTMGLGQMRTTVSTGSDTQTVDTVELLTIPMGTETGSMGVPSATGVATVAMGTETESMGFPLALGLSTGAETESYSNNAVANVASFTSAATSVPATTPNPPEWTNPTNAQGDVNGTTADHAGFGGATDVNGFDSTLRCAGMVAPATPSGFTAGSSYIKVVHQWDLTITAAVAGVTDVTSAIDLYDNAGVFIVNLSTKTASGGGGNSGGGGTPVMVTELFDITASTTGAQRAAGLRVYCHFFTTGAPTGTVNGTTSWNVDAVHLIGSSTRSGIA